MDVVSGVCHKNVSCVECRETGLRGIRWKCSLCNDCDLCHKCYMSNKHDVSHKFTRIDIANVNSDTVRYKRKTSLLPCAARSGGLKI